MLHQLTTLKGYAIDATDGRMGVVADFLFDDRTWRLRWLVIRAAGWFNGRKVLVHPSAIEEADHRRRELRVKITRAQIDASPNVSEDEPVSQQAEANLFEYYGWNPLWNGCSESGFMAAPLIVSPFPEGANAASHGDPHLRSASEIAGYHIHAVDGVIGHIQEFLVSDSNWTIHYLVADTRNWLPGRHVLLSPVAVREILWSEHQVRLDVTKDKVLASPPWDPRDPTAEEYEKRLHTHYRWPGHNSPFLAPQLDAEVDRSTCTANNAALSLTQ